MTKFDEQMKRWEAILGEAADGSKRKLWKCTLST